MIEISLGAAASEPSWVEQLLQVLGALAPFAVLVGVWLGKRWEQSGVATAWLRERRLDAYTRLTAALAEVEREAVWATTFHTQAKRLGAVTAMTTASFPFTAAAAEIRLLGPTDAADAADDVIDSYRSMMQAVGQACEAAPEGAGLAVLDHDDAITAELLFTTAAQRAIQ